MSRHEINKMDSNQQPAVNFLLGKFFGLVHKETCGAVMQVDLLGVETHTLVGSCCLQEPGPEGSTCFS